MSRVVVTGSAGFIGSHIVEACLERGDEVVGIDLMTDYYDLEQKRNNISRALDHDRFEFIETDLASGCEEMLSGADVVFHQAGQPGVRASWRELFDEYVSRNVIATQRLLEASVRCGVGRVVYASSSSVYGNAETYPVDESARPAPHSPYGVTKLAAEHLCSLYAANFGLSTVSLRYFTVYGPRQRPDMATHRLFEAALEGQSFPLFGTGEQLRDFTFVADVVKANLLAAEADVAPGLVVNIAGGSACSMNALIEMVEQISGQPIAVDRSEAALGDVRRTGGSTAAADRHLDWRPAVELGEGLQRQFEWHRSLR